MKPVQPVKHLPSSEAHQDAPEPCSPHCDEIARWSSRGGALPRRLAAHTRQCAACADRIRRVNQAHAALMLLRTARSPANLHARANGRALRMLRRAARASAAAGRLLAMRPNLTPWQRAQIHVARVSLSAAAALLTLVVRAGVLTGIERTQAMGEQLASAHWDRHIDPQGEWIEPPYRA